MDKKLIKRLLTIAGAGLTVSAIIFIVLHFYIGPGSNIYLLLALLDILLSNSFLIIKNQMK